MKKFKYDKDKVKFQASGQWGYILGNLCPELSEALQKAGKHTWCPNPGHRGKHGDAFRLFKDFEATGGGICNTCGVKADGLSLIMWLTGWTFSETLEAVAHTIGLEPDQELPQRRKIRQVPRVDTSAADKKKAESFCASLNRTWNRSLPLDHPEAEPVRLYLARRGLNTGHLPATLRFHPGLAYFDAEQEKITGTWPAMVALVQDIDGKPITLHRTYLTSDGHKAPVGSAKKLMSYPDIDRDLSGAAIRLGPAAPYMGVAEGLETGLSVQQVTGMSMWVTISNVLMEKVKLPTECRMAFAWADKDRAGSQGYEPGQRSAKIFVQKQWNEGRKASVLLPGLELGGDKSVDWNDVLLREGPNGFPQFRTNTGIYKSVI